MLDSKDIFWELHPVFFLSRFVGLSPYTKRFKISCVWISVTIFYLILTLSDSTLIMIAMEKVNTTFILSPYSLILERVQLLLVTITMTTSLFLAITNAKSLAELMESFLRADRDLWKVGVFISPSRRFCFKTVAIRFAIIFAILIYEIRHTLSSIQQLLVQYIILAPLTLGCVAEAQYMVLINAVRHRINVMILDMKEDKAQSYSAKSKKLETFVIIHSSLVESSSVINSLYAIQILMLISSIFINSTANLYHLIEKTVDLVRLYNYKDFATLMVMVCRVTARSFEVWSVAATSFDTQETVS
ncbi:Hypothetical protein NTJ_14064 [Nesidiocoris tenuis]|uniref:Gustatory receptor n=1 Tax=Nesidiocoris tenuis TaxID=355587 RepID=A0ABN7BA28_9HEMI|nr:Hypothetical protein NTJ_14064 [Nesidiocoris tenuis]